MWCWWRTRPIWPRCRLRLAGAKLVPVPTDEDGVLPDALEELVLRERPKLLYLIPDFQNPTGRTLPAERRRAVADVAGRHGLWIAEDDPYGELRFEGGAPPWIASYEAAATVRCCWAASPR